MKMNGGVTRELSSGRMRVREARRPVPGPSPRQGRAEVRLASAPRAVPGRPTRFRAAGVLAGVVGIALIGCTTLPATSWQVQPAFRIVDGGPSAVPGYLALARQHEAGGRPAQALAAYQKAANAAPQDADLQNTLGLALARGGQFELAVVALRRAVALAPGRAQLLNNLGYALLLAGRHDEARRMLSLTLAVDPTHELARRNLGHIDQAGPALAGGPAVNEAARVEAPGPSTQRADTGADRRPVAGADVPPAMAMAAAPPQGKDAAATAAVPTATAAATAATVATVANVATIANVANVATVATVASVPAVPARQHPDWRGVSIEIVNGNGVDGAAARLGRLLRVEGLHVGRLANRLPYDTPRTMLLYRSEKAELARAMARRLPVQVTVAPAPAASSRADLSLLLGHDLRRDAGCAALGACAATSLALRVPGRGPGASGLQGEQAE
jgi:Flp pilus assembly protein TadD